MWLLLGVSTFAMLITYMLTRNEARVYKAAATMATGIISYTGSDNSAVGWIQEYKVENDFNNLIAMLTSRASIGNLTYHMLKHDLEAPNNAFKKDDLLKVLEKYEKAKLQQGVDMFLSNPDSVWAGSGFVPYRREVTDAAKLMGYDQTTLAKSLNIHRIKDTDYLRVEFTSGVPEMSAFVVNSLCRSFIAGYTRQKSEKSVNSLDFYQKLVADKKTELESKLNALEQYKLSKNVANLDQQTKTTLDQIRELEIKREEAAKKVASSGHVLKNLDGYMSNEVPMQRETQHNNSRILSLQERINELNDQYIESGYKNQNIYRQKEQLKKELDYEVNKTASFAPDETPRTSNAQTKRDVFNRKLDAESELEEAKATVSVLDKELARLRGGISGLVSSEASLTSFEREIQVLQNEYLVLVEKLNQAEFASLSVKANTNTLKLQEAAIVPEKPESSKAPFISLLAGIAGFTLTTLILIGLVYVDNSLSSPHQLRKFTKLPLLEVLGWVNVKELDLKQLFMHGAEKGHLETFKQLVRNIRYKIDAMPDAQTLLFTGLKKQEGRTFVIVTMGYALSLNHKKVLLIDSNFKNNTLSRLPTDEAPRTDLLNDTLHVFGLQKVFSPTGILFSNRLGSVEILGCRNDVKSPSELFAGLDFKGFMQEMRRQYDYILIEAPALNQYMDAKELSVFSDKIIAVLSAKTNITTHDQPSINYLQNIGTKFAGVILNKMDLKNMELE